MSWSLNDLKSKAAAALGMSDTDDAKSKCRQMFQSAAGRVAELRETVAGKLNTAAEKTAEACTEWTGRETSAKEVKRVAVAGAVIGATISAAMSMGPAGGMVARQATRAAGAGGFGVPNSGCDEQAIEQDAIEYDRLQYDQHLDHLAHQDHLDTVIDDQISYGMDSFDAF